jgi:5'-AMP-activated protein kinase regulatory beta subunit
MAIKTVGKTKVNFELHAPEAKDVLLAGSFTEWGQTPVRLKRQKNGTWKTTIPLDRGTYEYRFLVDGQWQDDPQCHEHVSNPFGDRNCICTVLQ